MSYDNLIFIKENLTLLNYLTGIISFIIGISPLLVDRETLEKHNKPVWIETSAFIFLIYMIFLLFMQIYAERPLYKKNDCILKKEVYFYDEDFKSIINKKYQIKDIGEQNYLLKSNSHFLIIPKKHDYRYKKIKC